MAKRLDVRRRARESRDRLDVGEQSKSYEGHNSDRESYGERSTDLIAQRLGV
jgi:hypothetical protein